VKRRKILRGVGIDSGLATTAPARQTVPLAQTSFVLEKMEEMQKSIQELLARVGTIADEMRNFQKQMED
jgi:hypothetical protein